jgi:hypothetical protein
MARSFSPLGRWAQRVVAQILSSATPQADQENRTIRLMQISVAEGNRFATTSATRAQGPDRMEICRSLAEPDRMLAACWLFACRR